MNSERSQSIDLIKIVAMLGVISLHATYGYIEEGKWGLADFMYQTSVVSVPLFFMVSGYLLLGRSYTIRQAYLYSFRKIWGILKYVAVFSLLYGIFIIPIEGFHPKMIVRNFVLSFIQDGSLWVFWYLGAMMILYLVYPLLNFLVNTQKKYFMVLFLFCLTLSQIVFILNLTASLETPFEHSINQSLRLYNWVGYFMLGAVVQRKMNVSPFGKLVIVIVFIMVNLLLQNTLNPMLHTDYCEYYYASFFVYILVFFVFKFFNDLQIHNNRIISTLSCLFLPVYSLHIFILNFQPMYAFYDSWKIAPFLNWLSVSVITIIISYVIMRIPIVNRYFRL